MSRSEWQDAADRLSEAYARGDVGDTEWFAGMAAIFDEAYLERDDARAQSGFGGDESRWELARRPIAWAVDRAGTFVDIGCANGHLMECVVRWSAFPVEPFGLDFSERLVELARARLPHWRDRIFLGNALTWKPPFRFDFVRTELLYVPERHRRLLTERLLNEVVAPGGRLIVCGYGSPRSGVRAHPVREVVRSFGLTPETEFEVDAPEGGGAIIEIAVLRARDRSPAPGSSYAGREDLPV